MHRGDPMAMLQAASAEGHNDIVELLLNKGANVNAQGGFQGNALSAASTGSHEKAVQLLLDKGAIVKVQGGPYGTALQAALTLGHEKVIQLLQNYRSQTKQSNVGISIYYQTAEGKEIYDENHSTMDSIISSWYQTLSIISTANPQEFSA